MMWDHENINAIKEKMSGAYLFVAVVLAQVLFLGVICNSSIVSVASAVLIMISFVIHVMFESDYTTKMLVETKKLYDSRYTFEISSQISKCEIIPCHIGRREIKRYSYSYKYYHQGKEYETASNFHGWKPIAVGTQRIIHIDPDSPEIVYDRELIKNEIRNSRIENINMIIWIVSFIGFIYSVRS